MRSLDDLRSTEIESQRLSEKCLFWPFPVCKKIEYFRAVWQMGRLVPTDLFPVYKPENWVEVEYVALAVTR